MYITRKRYLKRLDINEYIALRALCRYSKDMYNIGLYSVRQYFFENEKYLSYESNYHLLKDNEIYKLLGAKTSQNVLKQVDENFKSFFELLKLKTSGKYDKKVNIPKYMDKEGFNYILIDKFTVSKGRLKIYMSKEFENLYGKIYIKVPENFKNIVNIKIVPKYDCRIFEVHFTMDVEEKDLNLNKDNCLSIDFGINNLCTCVTNKGSNFIIDGKYLKSVNQYTNKQNAYLKSILDKSGQSTSKRLDMLWYKRNNKIDDYLNKTTSFIINYLIQNDIGTFVLGYNQNFKEDLNLGKVNNQNFVNIPISRLKDKLVFKCKLLGIDCVIQEESYTSKASFLDNDDIPVYGKNDSKKFSGIRIKRGLYKSSKGILINADINGALNILRKSDKTDFKDFNIKNIFNINKINILKVDQKARLYGVEVA